MPFLLHFVPCLKDWITASQLRWWLPSSEPDMDHYGSSSIILFFKVVLKIKRLFQSSVSYLPKQNNTKKPIFMFSRRRLQILSDRWRLSKIWNDNGYVGFSKQNNVEKPFEGEQRRDRAVTAPFTSELLLICLLSNKTWSSWHPPVLSTGNHEIQPENELACCWLITPTKWDLQSELLSSFFISSSEVPLRKCYENPMANQWDGITSRLRQLKFVFKGYIYMLPLLRTRMIPVCFDITFNKAKRKKRITTQTVWSLLILQVCRT